MSFSTHTADDLIIRTSKYLSLVLRHKPEIINLQLDRDGWANIDELISCAAKAGKRLDRRLIEQVVAGNDKKRFGLSEDGKKIRAVQGHSTEQVRMQMEEVEPPLQLYHGTATRFLTSILTKGLISGSRHHVHLSGDVETAVKVGKRHGQPVVLKIDTQGMLKNGLSFYRAENGVWLTDHVPVEFIQQM